MARPTDLRPLLCAFSLALLTACASGPALGPALPTQPGGPDNPGLLAVRAAAFDSARILPGVDLRGYRAVYLAPVEVQFRRGWREDYNGRTPWSHRLIAVNDQATLERDLAGWLAQAWRARLATAGYRLVDAPAPDALAVTLQLADVDLSEPGIDWSHFSRTLTRVAGSARLTITVTAGQTGAPALILADDHEVEHSGARRLERTDALTNEVDFTRQFEHWAESFLGAVRATPVSGLAPAAPQPGAAT